MKTLNRLTAILATSVLLAACSNEPSDTTNAEPAMKEHGGINAEEHAGEKAAGNMPSHTAIALLAPTTGNTAKGKVVLAEHKDGVKLQITLSGLTPGKHGFHVHANGDCSSGDGKSAGGHYNPNDNQHGAPDSSSRHVGDLGNVTADAQGNVNETRTDKTMKLSGFLSVVGKAFIVHGGADDLSSQPSGAAGPRVACGVIQSPQ